MRKLLYFLFLTYSLILFGQKKEKFHLQNLSSEIKSIYLEGEDCIHNSENSCVQIFKRMVNEAKKRKDCVPCAEIELTRVYFFEGTYDSAILTGIKLLEKIQDKGDKLYLELNQDLNNIIGISHAQKGEFKPAIQYLTRSREIIEKLGNKDQVALVNVNIGLIYNQLGDVNKAIYYNKKSLSELQKLGVEKQNGAIASNISNFYNDLKKYDSAIYWSDLAIQYAKREKDSRVEVAGYYLKSAAYENVNIDSALYYVNKSIPLAEKLNISSYLHTSYLVKGHVLSKKGDYQNAKNYYEKSIEGFKESDKLNSLENAYLSLAKAGLEFKDFETSSKFFSLYTELSDSLRKDEAQTELNELNTKYETEKKEKLIAEQDLKIQKQTTNFWIAILGGLLLASILGGIYYTNRKSNQNKLIQLQAEKENAILNSFIQGEERERNRISNELHDGVAAMLGAAKMSIESIPHLPPEKQKEQLVRIKTILENTHADVRHIAHNLLPTVLEKEGLIKATEHFANELNASKLIQISVVDHQSKANELKPQLQLMLFRVIQELINNTIKHSQAQMASIEFSRNQNGLQIEVTDDGIGFDGDINDGNQGLYSISQRLKSIGGNFKFIKKKDRGMKAVAELKV